MVKKFVIPLVKDELLTSHAGQYFVEEIIPLRAVSQAVDGDKSYFKITINMLCICYIVLLDVNTI